VNMGNYYFIGVPLGVLLGWGFNYGIPVCLWRKTSRWTAPCVYLYSMLTLICHFCREYGLEWSAAQRCRL
jgi:MATE family multidrug resistance protein